MHVREHVDNMAAEAVADRGRAKTHEMQVLTTRRFERLQREEAFSATFRITSVDNDIADGLSRGGSKLADAIRMAAQTGLTVIRLEPDAGEDHLQSYLQ